MCMSSIKCALVLLLASRTYGTFNSMICFFFFFLYTFLFVVVYFLFCSFEQCAHEYDIESINVPCILSHMMIFILRFSVQL